MKQPIPWRIRLSDILRKSVIASLVLFITSAQGSENSAQTVVHRDNISASLAVTSSEAVVNYRFFGEISPPLSEIIGTMNGQPLLEPGITKYPGFGARAATLVMLDTTDRSRSRQIVSDRSDALRLLNGIGSHQAAAIALYGDKLKLTESHSGDPGENINAAAFASIISAPANLGMVLREAIKLTAAVEADRLRHDIIVFTDGHFDDLLDARAIIAQASQSDISISFILSTSEREVALPAIAPIASATGGRMVMPNERNNLNGILEYINSGGVVRFPLGTARRYFWQSRPEVKITFVHGDKQLIVTAPAPLPAAGPVETAHYIGSRHPFVAGSAGAAVLALLAGAIFLARRPRQATEGAVAPIAAADEPELKPVFAVLQNIDDGSSHPIRSDRVNIGRASTNDIVIDDKAVSREHAVMFRDGDGRFAIENRGANGTSVNHLRVEQTPLVNGDLITIGDTTLRFVQVGA